MSAGSSAVSVTCILKMVYRRRKICVGLLAVACFCVCTILFPPNNVRAVLSDYMTLPDGEARRLLQDTKPNVSSEKKKEKEDEKKTNVAVIVKSVKISGSHYNLHKVPIFWDDGEFMEEDERIVTGQKAFSEFTDVPALGNRTRGKHETGLKASPNNATQLHPKPSLYSNRRPPVKEPTKTDRSMSVLDYKLSQFQTVKYTNNLMAPEKAQSLENAGSPEATARVLPVHLIIVTQRRSGSSFLGQIFNQNPWVFFHFEPLKLLEIKKDVYDSPAVLLENLFKCRFDRTPFLMDLYNNETLHRMSSKVLCSPPLCRTNVDYNLMRSGNVRNCGSLRSETVANVCDVYPHKVVKLIRLYSLDTLLPLLQSKDLNVKIVHLLRDPRGTLSSRAKEHPNSTKSLSPGPSLQRNAAYICRRMRRNFRFVRENDAIMKDRYVRVRYEDIATDPVRWARLLYRFAGMGDVPVEVFRWIQENTRDNTREEARDTYSTHRNSSATAQAWRHNLDFPVVNEIQRYCVDVLSEAGYVEVREANQLQSNNHSLVVPIT